jgi:hypothetical protein
MANSLPRSLDVVVNITTPAIESAASLQNGCLITDTARPSGWTSNQIVAFYPDLDSVAAVGHFPSGDAYNAAVNFFAQSPRPTQLAIGLHPADQAYGTLTFAANPTVGDTVTVGSQTYTFKSTLTTANDVKIGSTEDDSATNLLLAITGAGVAGTNYYAGTTAVSTVTVTKATVTSHAVLTVTAVAYGTSGASIALAESGSSVAVSAATLANHENVATSAANIQEEATAGGNKIFGWALDATLRTVTHQHNLVDWCEANYLAAFLCTNDINAKLASSVSDIGYVLTSGSHTCATVFYHDTASEYPDMAAMAIMLSVDYAGADTTKTLKFKTCSGITASVLNSTQHGNLNAKNYNMVAKTGNTSIITREGKTTAASWYTDQYIGIQNLREEIQTAVFNVFLAKKKVPYTATGQAYLSAACKQVLRRYVTNGFLADRESTDDEGQPTTLPAFSVVPGAISAMTASDRAQRIGPPIAITCYLAGAIHKVTLNIDMIP